MKWQRRNDYGKELGLCKTLVVFTILMKLCIVWKRRKGVAKEENLEWQSRNDYGKELGFNNMQRLATEEKKTN